MHSSHAVDWNKTCLNIANRLHGLTWKKDLASVFNWSEDRAKHKFNGDPLPVEELYLFSSLLGCSINDLLVFEHDTFVEPERCTVNKRERMPLSSLVKMSNQIDFNAGYLRNCEIQNLAEFLLYLPLMPEDILHDVFFRCSGNLTSFDRFYFMRQMNYLYQSLPDIAAKDYADSYRDNVLRVKGDGELNYTPDEYSECCYSLISLLYTGQISKEKYMQQIEGLRDTFGR